MDKIREFMNCALMQETILSANEKGVPIRIAFLIAMWVNENEPILGTQDLQDRISQVEDSITSVSPHLYDDTQWPVYHSDYNVLEVRVHYAEDTKFLGKPPIYLQVAVSPIKTD